MAVLLSLHKVSPRLQQILLQLMKYKISVIYVTSKNKYIADALSRAYVNISEETDENTLEYKIHDVSELLPM
jgi:hypothetical protein